MTIGDLLRWCRTNEDAKICFDKWSDADIVYSAEQRIKKNELIVCTKSNEIKGVLVFEVQHDKKRIYVENVISDGKGILGKLLEQVFQMYGYGILTSGEWTIGGERIGPFKHRTHGRNFKINPKFLKKLYAYG